MSNSTVKIDEIAGKGRSFFVSVTLNAPLTLNAIQLTMVDELYAHLMKWCNDPNIAGILLKGAGGKAFCAGGDLQMLYDAMDGKTSQVSAEYAERFFEHEYRLDYLIHTYPKPIVVLGNGVVMGGGLGLMAGASHRIVTPSTRLSMPEITIGLFPDVGASWFLRQMPGGSGLFAGLTGCVLNANDVLYARLGDCCLGDDAVNELPAALEQTAWERNPAFNHKRLDDLLLEITEMTMRHTNLPNAKLAEYANIIEDVTSHRDLVQIAQAIRQIETDDPWLRRAIQKFSAGSPTTAHLVFRLLRTDKIHDLKTAFREELIVAVQCTRHPDFKEGIRALLIDKDRRPRWRYRHTEAVPEEWVDEHFAWPWENSAHPLSDL